VEEPRHFVRGLNFFESFHAILMSAARPDIEQSCYGDGSGYGFAPDPSPPARPSDEALTGLGDLTSDEVNQIQALVEEAGQPIWVVGGAAKGTRRNVGTNLPFKRLLGEKTSSTRSDIDYFFEYDKIDVYGRPRMDVFRRLPDLDTRHGILGGWVRRRLTTGILFQPGKPPEVHPPDPFR
jgi:hypothetical protein